MYNGSLKSSLRSNFSNIPGWKTKRKIVVIESDDWGSIRMSSEQAYKNLLTAGIPVDLDHYNKFDSLESNKDMVMLMERLSTFKDITGRAPVITGVNVVANPDFEKIADNDFTEYYYESYRETLKRYPEHDKVYGLWQVGISNRLIVPVFHGREHLNAKFWIKAFQSGNKSTQLAFQNKVTGIPRTGIKGEIVPNFQAAFDIDTLDDIPFLKDVLQTGLDLFEDLYGYRSKYFVPTNGWFNNSLEKNLNEFGIKYINTAKKQREPLGLGQYKTNTRFIGQQNQFGQIYLTRNCFFEPSSSGYEHPASTDWVNNCLKEIEIAFRWNKPATLSSHRVNYIGFLHPENRERSLKKLEELLTKMLKKWPDIEFMTSVELGDLITSEKK